MIRTGDGAAWAGDGVFWYKQDFKSHSLFD